MIVNEELEYFKYLQDPPGQQWVTDDEDYKSNAGVPFSTCTYQLHEWTENLHVLMLPEHPKLQRRMLKITSHDFLSNFVYVICFFRVLSLKNIHEHNGLVLNYVKGRQVTQLKTSEQS